MGTSAFGSNLIKVLAEEPRGGFIYRKELVNAGPGGADENKPVEIESGYTPSGDWIGELATAEFLVNKLGLTVIEKRDPAHSVCSIGFHEKEQKWYGWSHRAIVGFGIGDMIFEEDFGDDQTPYVMHGTQPIVTLDDAKQAAKNFAESVS